MVRVPGAWMVAGVDRVELAREVNIAGVQLVDVGGARSRRARAPRPGRRRRARPPPRARAARRGSGRRQRGPGRRAVLDSARSFYSSEIPETSNSTGDNARRAACQAALWRATRPPPTALATAARACAPGRATQAIRAGGPLATASRPSGAPCAGAFNRSVRITPRPSPTALGRRRLRGSHSLSPCSPAGGRRRCCTVPEVVADPGSRRRPAVVFRAAGASHRA